MYMKVVVKMLRKLSIDIYQLLDEAEYNPSDDTKAAFNDCFLLSFTQNHS